MFYTIYQITNKINNKIYIGMHQTKNLDDEYMGSGKLIQRAINKHGIENFTKSILFTFDNEHDMKEKEKELVTQELIESGNSYNLCPGGRGGWGYINSNEKIRVAKNKKAASVMHEQMRLGKFPRTHRQTLAESHKKSISEGLKGNKNSLNKKLSEETKSKMSLAHRGEKNSQFGTMWITNGIENKKIKPLDIIPEGWYKGYRPKRNV